MVYLYYCQACDRDDHAHCELGHPAPKGVCGGSRCKCPCRGNPKFNDPDLIAKEFREMIKKACDFYKPKLCKNCNNELNVLETAEDANLKGLCEDCYFGALGELIESSQIC